jgi:hypothetical protein
MIIAYDLLFLVLQKFDLPNELRLEVHPSTLSQLKKFKQKHAHFLKLPNSNSAHNADQNEDPLLEETNLIYQDLRTQEVSYILS